MQKYCFSSPIGIMELCEQNQKIVRLSLLNGQTGPAMAERTGTPSELLREGERQLQEYFRGERKEFTLPLGCEGTPFQQRVWSALQDIPYGQVKSYEEIAIAIDNPKATQAVGQANHRNPLMIIIPCHRVIHKNGDITGYGYGTEIKQILLSLEKKYSQ